MRDPLGGEDRSSRPLLGCAFFLWFVVALAQPHETLGEAMSDGALMLLFAMWLACLLGLIIGRYR